MKTPTEVAPWLLALLTTFALVAGCGKSPVATTAVGPDVYANPTFARVPTPPPGAFGANPDEPIMGAQEIDGAQGGEVAVGRFRVIVPPGAFAGMATISVTVPDPEVVLCELDISPPEANGFAVPVSLVADCRGVTNVDLSACGTLWFDEQAHVWRTVKGAAVDLANQTVTVSLAHFSTYGVADLLGKAGW